MTTQTVTGFRLPWTGGAHAYPEADTFSAAKEGFKRRRKGVMFHMPNTGEAGAQSCAYCGGILAEPALAASKDHGNNTRSEQSAAVKPDRFSTWHYDPRGKRVIGGVHYQCSWSNLLGAISSIRSF